MEPCLLLPAVLCHGTYRGKATDSFFSGIPGTANQCIINSTLHGKLHMNNDAEVFVSSVALKKNQVLGKVAKVKRNTILMGSSVRGNSIKSPLKHFRKDCALTCLSDNNLNEASKLKFLQLRLLSLSFYNFISVKTRYIWPDLVQRVLVPEIKTREETMTHQERYHLAGQTCKGREDLGQSSLVALNRSDIEPEGFQGQHGPHKVVFNASLLKCLF